MASRFLGLWQAIEQELTSWNPEWVEKIQSLDQVSRIHKRNNGLRYSDSEIFEGLVKAVLSGNTDWSRVQLLLPELRERFNGFSIKWYAMLKQEQVQEELVNWFEDRNAGSAYLKRNLILLIDTANHLLLRINVHQSLENYLQSLLKQIPHGEVALLAYALGSNGEHKLPALGIPIAAEALKNIGYDVAKPDRHINRALGSFGLQEFRRWPERQGTIAPVPRRRELLQVMQVMQEMANNLGFKAVSLDNRLWLLCAKSGAYKSNEQLFEIGRLSVTGR